MMTAEEKAKQLAKWIVDGALRQDEIEKSIIQLLKEQDRDTRHLCTEAVLSRRDKCGFILACDAHAAIMNAGGKP